MINFNNVRNKKKNAENIIKIGRRFPTIYTEY